MNLKRFQRIWLALFCIVIFSSNAHADTLFLKSGKEIVGNIVENTEEHISIDCMGIGFIKKYKKSVIKSIELTQKIQSATSPVVSPDTTSQSESKRADIVKNDHFILYVPKGIESGRKYPLIVGFHPGGNAQAIIDQWKLLAEKYKLLVFATKESRNGQNMMEGFPIIKSRIEREVFYKYPIDKRRVIATGISGGGMCSHFMTFMYNDFLSAIIVNTGMMHEYQKKNKSKCARNKLAVMLASPTDFRYDEMIQDNEFLRYKLNWQTTWIEFEGGHGPAPQRHYEEGIEWLLEKL